MKKRKSQLRLHKETIRSLTSTELNDVAGGRRTPGAQLTDRNCYYSMLSGCIMCPTALPCLTTNCY